MPDSLVISASVWRHICPKIRDLTFSIPAAKPYAELVLPKDLVLQGAGVPNKLIQELFKTQGAFKAHPEIVVAPTKGTLETSGLGWIYKKTGSIAAGTSDTFQFRLLINNEPSASALVTVNFV